MLGVVKLELVPAVLVYSRVPPEDASYQVKTPVTVDVAPKVTVPVPHRLAAIPTTEVATTFAVTATLALVHVPLEYST